MKKEFKHVENTLKKWSIAFSIIAIVLAALSTLAAFIVFCIDVEYNWWIALIIFGGGFVLAIPLIFSSHLTWGFAEIVSNTKRMAGGNPEKQESVDTLLPEL